MRTFRHLLVATLVAGVGTAPLHAAQHHVIDPQSIAETVKQHTESQEQARAQVREALARPEVQAVADRAGIDVTRLAAAVGTMSGADLDRAAASAREVNTTLVGGASTVVISTTTIIIALLVIILLVVAID